MPDDLLYPSLALARVVGYGRATRGEMIARLMHYVDGHDLRDPADPQTVILDRALLLVFGRERLTVGEMEQQIGNHLV